MDYVAHFGREVAAFETAGRAAQGAQPAPAVPIRCDGPAMVPHNGPCDVELHGTASDLMLFLWQRIRAGTGSLVAQGDVSLLDRYFVLVPPL